MARKEKKKRKNKRNRYTTGDRVDMRTGGRVSLKHGVSSHTLWYSW